MLRMNNYNNNSNRSQGGYRSENRGSSRPRFGSRDSRQSEMHDATCAQCGDSCKVPFRPTSGKPVFCSKCFEKKDQGSSNSNGSRFSDKRSFSPRPQQRPQEDYSKQLGVLSHKMDIIIKMLSEKKVVKKAAEPEAEQKEVAAKTKAVKKTAKPKAKKKEVAVETTEA